MLSRRLGIVVAGIVFGQVLLYGPSLIGRKVLLPLDLLQAPAIYTPVQPGTETAVAQNLYLSDLLYIFEPARRFAAAEFHQGRLPTWAPYQFAGVPFTWPRFSPFLILAALRESPTMIAWAQLAASLVAGVGFYAFSRRVLEVGFWPAAICAWCYPLTAFFVFWQGYPTAMPAYWLPWLLLAVDRAVGRSGTQETSLPGTSTERGPGLAPVGVALATMLVLVSGHLDVAGQVLLGSGLYAAWRLAGLAWKSSKPEGRRRLLAHLPWRALGRLTAGWALGFLLASPYLLPVLEYTRQGARIERRRAGEEERPPVGLSALPQVVLPELYGSYGRMKPGTYYLAGPNQIESAAAAYAGVVAALVLAPLAWCSRRHRALNLFWAGLSFFGLSWCLNIPGLVQLLRLPGLNMMSHNRLVFLFAFAVLAMAAGGLEVLRRDELSRRRWWCVPPALLAGLCIWCLYRSLNLPEPLSSQLAAGILSGKRAGWITSLADVHQAQDWFVRHYISAAAWCGLGAVLWALLWFGLSPKKGGGRWAAWRSRVWLTGMATLMLADLLGFAWGKSVQSDPAAYFPRVPVLEQVAKAAPGRVIGYNCLPANLAAMAGLRDVRGYDSVDPARMLELLALASNARSRPSYALSQKMAPRIVPAPDGRIRLSPILDMLNVGYVLFRGSPPATLRPAFQGTDYWVMRNEFALPRAYVPAAVQLQTNSARQLEELASASFDPRSLAYVESPMDLPAGCRGTAQLTAETPTRLSFAVHMETPGLLVVADAWDSGWRAWFKDKPVSILRANHALRGVVLPTGDGILQMRYEPARYRLGLLLAALAGAAMGALAASTLAAARRNQRSACGAS